MNAADYGFYSSVLTVVMLIVFLGIVAWAYSRRRKAAFEEAANAPFALPDDNGDMISAGQRTGRQP